MIVSTATAVLPVWRSPMINSRCPRPIGTMPSMALRPVCSGSLTGERSTTPGASRSIGMDCFAAIGPLPSIGWPSALTTRPISLVADGDGNDAARALDGIAFLDARRVAEENGADAFLFEIQRDAEQPVRELDHFAGHGAFDAVDASDTVAARDDGPYFRDVDVRGIVTDPIADDLGDFFGLDLHSWVR